MFTTNHFRLLGLLAAAMAHGRFHMADDLSGAVPPSGGEEWPEGDLPEQMGGPRTLLMPGVSTFRLPENLAQLWHDVAIEDTRNYMANGQVNPTGPLANGGHGKKVLRKQLKFDRNSPLIVVGGKQDGEPMTATFTTNPRARGKKDDPKTPWISDIAYMLDICLQDKTRPVGADQTVAAVNKYAGKTIRLAHGLTAQCREDKVRYIVVQTVDNGQTVEANIPDPTGTKGCGKRWYTSAFKNPETGQYDAEIACVCGKPSAEAVAAATAAGQPPPQEVLVVLRAYESVERFQPPLAGGTGAATGATPSPTAGV